MLSIVNFSASNSYLTNCNVSTLNTISSSTLACLANVSFDVQSQLNTLSNNLTNFSCTNASISTLNTNVVYNTCFVNTSRSSLNTVTCSNLNASVITCNTCIVTPYVSASVLTCTNVSFVQGGGVSLSLLSLSTSLLTCSTVSTSSVSASFLTCPTIQSVSISSSSINSSIINTCFVIGTIGTLSLTNTSFLRVGSDAFINGCLVVGNIMCSSSLTVSSLTASLISVPKTNTCILNACTISTYTTNTCFINAFNTSLLVYLQGLHTNVQAQFDGITTSNGMFANVCGVSACFVNASITTLLTCPTASFNSVTTSNASIAVLNTNTLNTSQLCGYNATLIGLLQNACGNIQSQLNNIKTVSGSYTNVSAVTAQVSDTITTAKIVASNIDTTTIRSSIVNTPLLNASLINGYSTAPLQYLTGVTSPLQAQISYYYGYLVGLCSSLTKQGTALSSQINILNVQVNALRSACTTLSSANIQSLSVSYMNASSVFANTTNASVLVLNQTDTDAVVLRTVTENSTKKLYFSDASMSLPNIRFCFDTTSPYIESSNSAPILFADISVSGTVNTCFLNNINVSFLSGLKDNIQTQINTLALNTGNSSTLSVSLLFVNGNASIVGDVYAQNGYFTKNVVTGYSDDRLKIRTASLSSCLSNVLQLSTFKYIPNTEMCTQYDIPCRSEEDIGVSAQEVQGVFPELVCLAPCDNDNEQSRTGEHFITIRYERFIPVLIQSMKEMYQELTHIRRLYTSLTTKCAE